MSGILTYALHYEGEFNKNSLGAVSEAGRLAKELGQEAHAVVVGGDDLSDELCASLGNYGASKVWRAKAPEGLAQPVVDAMARLIQDNGYSYALFGGGLLGFEIGAGLTARLGAGVTMEVTDDQGPGRQTPCGAPDPAGLGDRRGRLFRRRRDHHRPPQRLRDPRRGQRRLG